MVFPFSRQLVVTVWHIYGALAEQPDFKQHKAPVKHILSRGCLVETAGIEPASEKRTTESPTGFFAR